VEGRTTHRLKRKLERLSTSTPIKKRKLLASSSRRKKITTRVSPLSTSTRTISLCVDFSLSKDFPSVFPLLTFLLLLSSPFQLREQERQRLVAERNPKLAALQEQQAMKKEHDVSPAFTSLSDYF